MALVGILCAAAEHAPLVVSQCRRPGGGGPATRYGEDRLAGRAQVRPFLLQTGDNAIDGRNLCAAQPEYVGRARGPLIRSAPPKRCGRCQAQRHRNDRRTARAKGRCGPHEAPHDGLPQLNSMSPGSARSWRGSAMMSAPRKCKSMTNSDRKWSERRDLNSGPPVPQTGALTGLRYAPRLQVDYSERVLRVQQRLSHRSSRAAKRDCVHCRVTLPATRLPDPS